MGGVGGAVAVTKIKYRHSPRSTAVVEKGDGGRKGSELVCYNDRACYNGECGIWLSSVYCHMSCVASMICGVVIKYVVIDQ